MAPIVQLNQLFQLLHLVHIYGHGFYELSRMLMRKNVNNDVSKDSLFWLGFVCAQVSSGICETMELQFCRQCLEVVLKFLIYRTWVTVCLLTVYRVKESERKWQQVESRVPLGVL